MHYGLTIKFKQMKNLLHILLFLPLFVLTLSCRNDDVPEDIHEHEEIEKLEVTLTNKNNATDVQVIQFIGGISDKAMNLKEGETYTVKLDFQVKHDDHYHSANSEVLEEKDEHFITFEFADSDISVKRSADDIARTDGKKLGLSTDWTINSVTETGNVIIKLVHGAVSVDDNFPSANNQLGKTTGGETDVNAKVGLH